jgi:hypothetical protein
MADWGQAIQVQTTQDTGTSRGICSSKLSQHALGILASRVSWFIDAAPLAICQEILTNMTHCVVFDISLVLIPD